MVSDARLAPSLRLEATSSLPWVLCIPRVSEVPGIPAVAPPRGDPGHLANQFAGRTPPKIRTSPVFRRGVVSARLSHYARLVNHSRHSPITHHPPPAESRAPPVSGVRSSPCSNTVTATGASAGRNPPPLSTWRCPSLAAAFAPNRFGRTVLEGLTVTEVKSQTVKSLTRKPCKSCS